VPSIGSKILLGDEAGNETAVRQATAAMFANGSAAVSWLNNFLLWFNLHQQAVSTLTTFILAMVEYSLVYAHNCWLT
jgi:uncharacterized membrane protein